ncbi:MAG TPA: hypothetical protein VGF08_13430 [Terriglobales bacterium]
MSTDVPTLEWRALYRQAMLETDNTKRQAMVTGVYCEILERLRNNRTLDLAEQDALNDALVGLRVMGVDGDWWKDAPES